jgi:nitrite reductase/ring-hydroxylating ferredoxin subunit
LRERSFAPHYRQLTRKSGEHHLDSYPGYLEETSEGRVEHMSFVEVSKVNEIPAGTMKHVEAGEKELCIANVSGTFYAIGDRCGHQNASLAMGTLQGKIVTCPLHFSRFDVTTGKKISGPVEAKLEGMDKFPPSFLAYAKRIAEIQAPIKTYDRQVFPVRVEGLGIFVDV